MFHNVIVLAMETHVCGSLGSYMSNSNALCTHACTCTCMFHTLSLEVICFLLGLDVGLPEQAISDGCPIGLRLVVEDTCKPTEINFHIFLMHGTDVIIVMYIHGLDSMIVSHAS